MGLNFAIDALYATGWTPDDPARCKRHADGRSYPDEQAVRRVFADQGCDLSIRHVQLFDCYRAEWRDPAAAVAGAVVGQTAEEACVYAMSQLRRQLLTTTEARA
jgi:hypothetical protein